MRNYLIIVFLLFCSAMLRAQVIPIGVSKDSVEFKDIHPYMLDTNFFRASTHTFYYYKPSTYDPATSPLLFAIHGTGGNGTGPINDLTYIAERRKAIIIAPNWDEIGSVGLRESVYRILDKTDSACSLLGGASEVVKQIYRHVLNREGRNSAASYMIGFSAGGQFVTRYMLIRQAYPDSIPLKMAVSSNPYYYTFPTDTLNNIPMPYMCGLLFDGGYWGDSALYCEHPSKFYHFDCPEHIKQYYEENYAVLIGTADTDPLSDNACAMEQGANRYERAYNFYNFGLTDAPNYGTTLNWQYKEIAGVGHDQYAMYNNKDSVNDPYTIAEKLLFDSPYKTQTRVAPLASFYATEDTVYLPSATVNFTNTSTLATDYLWEFGDSTTSTDVNPVHTYDTAGLYIVQLTATNSTGCDSWHIKRHYIRVLAPTGINETEADRLFTVYPNPANTEITVQYSGNEIAELSLINVLGKGCYKKEINKSQSEKIDVSDLSAGIYFIRITSSEGIFTKKAIVVR